MLESIHPRFLSAVVAGLGAEALIHFADLTERSLDRVLKRIDTRGVRLPERPQLQHALSNLDLFSSAAATGLSEFDSILRQIEAQCALYTADHEAADHAAAAYQMGVVGVSALKRNPEWVETIRKFIITAPELIPQVKQHLLA